jgi:MinD superfamily P-loop ATPase
MKEIVVISGKGGCGKTCVAAGLAYIASPDLVIGDADVDAADMHLLMNPKDTESKEFFSGKVAIVDNDKCILCRKCIDNCHFDAISIVDGKLLINPVDCEGCGLCSHICPTNAIKMEIQRAGHMFISTSKTNAPMVHARLDIGADNSGKLVTEVRKVSREVAEKLGKEIILTDGPPGIGCPVIASLSGASLALIVTEPTLSGWHDMSRVSALIKKMEVPGALLLNKEGINEEVSQKIRKFAEDNDLTFVGDLPYDPIFSKAVSEGLTIPEAGREDLLNKFHEIWEKILNVTPNK